MSEDNKKFPEPELTRKQIVPLKEFGLMKVMEWPDGTVIHINTEKGKENMRIHHSSGTFFEFCSDGTQVHFNSNNGVQYSKGGMTVTYDQSGDQKAAGHMRVNFDHDAHVTFQKNASIVVGAKTSIAALGELKVAAKGNLYLGSGQGKVIINGGKGIEMKGESGRVMIEGNGVVYLHSTKGDVHLQAAQDVVQISDGDNIVEAGGKVSEKADGDITNVAQGQANYDAYTKVVIGQDAQRVEVKPGGQQVTPTDYRFM